MLKHSLALSVIALVLGGCASHSHMLAQGSAPAFLNGELIHVQPSRLVLGYGERKYVAEGFEVRRHRNLAELHKRYHMSEPRHWDRISSGLDRDHESFSAEPKPKAANGEELTCRLAWRNDSSPQGICVDGAGNEFPIRFK